MTDTGLASPPADLEGFPEAGPVAQLHRLSESPDAWWFSSVGDVTNAGGGRFDPVEPKGTCYLAEESLEGALVEKLLRTPIKVVPAERLEELFHAVVAVRSTPRTADLTAARAAGFGLNAEIHSTLDYETPRRWAAALRTDGWRAVRHRLRGDTTQRLAGRALFGASGLHVRAPAGMSTSVDALDRGEAERLLADRNVEVRPIPTHVPIAPPPT
ncbi:MAG: RES family NAD+ phosphorylase [Thermoanaerobaculia bacterium]